MPKLFASFGWKFSNVHVSLTQTGYPNMSLLGNMAAMLDFEHIRKRRSIEGEIPGNLLRNQLNFDNLQVESVKDKNHRQTTFAEWTKDAIRWAYQYGRMEGYTDMMSLDVKGAIVRGRKKHPITADELRG